MLRYRLTSQYRNCSTLSAIGEESLIVGGRGIGGGAGYPTCPTESISLVPRPEAEQAPVLQPGELVTKVMKDRGREFML